MSESGSVRTGEPGDGIGAGDPHRGSVVGFYLRYGSISGFWLRSRASPSAGRAGGLRSRGVGTTTDVVTEQRHVELDQPAAWAVDQTALGDQRLADHRRLRRHSAEPPVDLADRLRAGP